MSDEANKRTKRPPNYVLETLRPETVALAEPWVKVIDGFVSPERAIEYAEKNKVQGTLRVVRVATPVFEGKVIVQEPTYTLTPIGGKTPRKRTSKKQSTGMTAGEAAAFAAAEPTSKPSLEEVCRQLDNEDGPEGLLQLRGQSPALAATQQGEDF